MSMKQIIIADDHEVVRAGISAALSSLPHIQIVAEVADGPGLFEALAHYHAHVLVLDVNMPAFEPLQAIDTIRKLYPQLKILVISAYDDDMYVQGLLRVGVDGYQLKDQPLADLRLALERILRGERWISSSLLGRLAQSSQQPIFQLTPRQRELLWCLQQGDDNQTIAQRMSLSVKTVENHLTRLYRQLNVQSRLEAVHVTGVYPELAQPLRTNTVGAPQASIVVVDDNKRYRQQLQRMLQAMAPHIIVLEASTAAEALDKIATAHPRLVLLDVILGDDDGIGCAAEIHRRWPLIRIVLISAYPDRAFQQRGLHAGALALIDKKDLDRASLQHILDDCLVH